jgi:hypothetical protein
MTIQLCKCRHVTGLQFLPAADNHPSSCPIRAEQHEHDASHLVSALKMHGAVPPIPPYAFINRYLIKHKGNWSVIINCALHTHTHTHTHTHHTFCSQPTVANIGTMFPGRPFEPISPKTQMRAPAGLLLTVSVNLAQKLLKRNQFKIYDILT